MTKQTVRYVDWEILDWLNRMAAKKNRNRSIKQEKIDSLDRTNLFPVVFNMIHNDKEMRCKFMLNREGDMGWIDISMDEFDALPSKEVDVE